MNCTLYARHLSRPALLEAMAMDLAVTATAGKYDEHRRSTFEGVKVNGGSVTHSEHPRAGRGQNRLDKAAVTLDGTNAMQSHLTSSNGEAQHCAIPG